MRFNQKKAKIHPYSMPNHLIDQDALQIVQRLQRFGYLAYFVGGCVRDSLLGAQPKDFDIVTSARPRELRQLFRNCRLIGRRFQLAHLYFGQHKIIEVATFRKKPHDDVIVKGMIQEDNEFGDAYTDAFRRDFTLNALLYDPLRHQILDYCGGMKDLNQNQLRVIGDPRLRFQEDPIRMLRAIKFKSRLGLQMDQDLIHALKSERLELAKVAPPRLFQELSRMICTSRNAESYKVLEDYQFLSLLLPEIHAHWIHYPHIRQAHQMLFEALAKSTQFHSLWSDSLSLSFLTWPICDHLVQNHHWHPEEFQHMFCRLFAPVCMRLGLSHQTLIQSAHVIESLIFMHHESGWTAYPQYIQDIHLMYILLRKGKLSLLNEDKYREIKDLLEKKMKQRSSVASSNSSRVSNENMSQSSRKRKGTSKKKTFSSRHRTHQHENLYEHNREGQKKKTSDEGEGGMSPDLGQSESSLGWKKKGKSKRGKRGNRRRRF